MQSVEEKFAARGLSLPSLFDGASARAVIFDRVRTRGGVAYVGGHGPMDGRTALLSGRIGDHLQGDWLSQEVGYEAARLTALSMFASLKHKLGSLDQVSGWLKVSGYVAVAPGFTGLTFVLNGFTDLVLDLWGVEGQHTSTAIGVAELPFDVPVWIEAVAELVSPRVD